MSRIAGLRPAMTECERRSTGDSHANIRSRFYSLRRHDDRCVGRGLSGPSNPVDRAAGPGSATDNAARLLGAALSQELGQQIIVDNRPGGALTIGLDLVAKSPPDGYTIGMGPIGALAITRHMVSKLPYDIERDFQPIALDHARTNVARGLAETTGEFGQGVDRLRQAEPREAYQCFIQQWLAGPCRCRTFQVYDRNENRSRALPRRLAGDHRSHCGSRRLDV